MGRLVAAVAVMLLVSCGGTTQRNLAEGGATEGGGGGAAGASFAGGGSSPAPSEPVLRLDDSFPWFDGKGTMAFDLGGENQPRVLHVAASGAPARATLSTHNIFDLLGQTSRLRFQVRASAPSALTVAAGRVQRSYDYFVESKVGRVWPHTVVAATPEWQDHVVSFADLSPAEPAEDVAQTSFYIAFVVDHPEPIDIWIDAVGVE